MEQFLNLKGIIGAITFSTIGLVVLMISFIAFDKFTPGNFWKEILEEDNIALAIIVGAVVLSMAQIVAAAIHG